MYIAAEGALFEATQGDEGRPSGSGSIAHDAARRIVVGEILVGEILGTRVDGRRPLQRLSRRTPQRAKYSETFRPYAQHDLAALTAGISGAKFGDRQGPRRRRGLDPSLGALQENDTAQRRPERVGPQLNCPSDGEWSHPSHPPHDEWAERSLQFR